MDTLAMSESLTPTAAAAHSNHATPTSHHHHSRTSISPETVLSPTDLSMRRDRSNVVDGTFTSPSSGFDSPSMHAGGSSGTAAVDGTAGSSGCSDSSAAADADRSESYVVSPSPRADAPSAETAAHVPVSRLHSCTYSYQAQVSTFLVLMTLTVFSTSREGGAEVVTHI